MAPKAVHLRKRFDRNYRFRGHGPLLQFVVQPPLVAHPPWMAYSPGGSARSIPCTADQVGRHTLVVVGTQCSVVVPSTLGRTQVQQHEQYGSVGGPRRQ